MNPWPERPILYEINTWVWLQELGKRRNAPVTLAGVPEEEWDALAGLGVDAVWFMGVWERSPAGIQVALGNEGLVADFRRALPDFAEADNVGSPYCVRRYAVDPHLGGAEGLAVARAELARRGLRLVLDFVPNHVAPDHPWTSEHPEYFVRGGAEDRRLDPASFLDVEGTVLACGRDPYFPAWPDVLQLNAFDPGARRAVAETLVSIADQCDGARCDMAMLVMNDVFQRTWGDRAGVRPAAEYWPEVIGAVRKRHPGFLFVAEAYWDLEWALQQQGFDFCYDKKLYDRLEHGPAESVRLHLCADMAYQGRLVRFLENHDEPRAAAAFPAGKGRTAAVAALTVPGAKLLHEGQFEGRKVRLPVFLGRRPDEAPDRELADFYRRLLAAISGEPFRSGRWELCLTTGWPDNMTCRNLLAWCWRNGTERCVIAVNLSECPSQALLRVPWEDLRGRTWRLEGALCGDAYERSGDEMVGPGLYVALEPWGRHFWRVVSLS